MWQPTVAPPVTSMNHLMASSITNDLVSVQAFLDARTDNELSILSHFLGEERAERVRESIRDKIDAVTNATGSALASKRRPRRRSTRLP